MIDEEQLTDDGGFCVTGLVWLKMTGASGTAHIMHNSRYDESEKQTVSLKQTKKQVLNSLWFIHSSHVMHLSSASFAMFVFLTSLLPLLSEYDAS